jgi:TonB family protein
MSSWMLYATLVSLLCGTAAWSLERTLPRFPLRWIWTAALVASCSVPFVARARPAAAPVDAAGAGVYVAGAPDAPPAAGALEPGAPPAPQQAGRVGLGWTSPALPAHLDRWAMLLWGVLSVVAATAVIRSSLLLRGSRRTWRAASLDGRTVMLSAEVGPAVVGVLRPAIVVPRWVLDAPRPDRELVLRHEEEHARARDPQLLFAALMLSVLLPWNLALLWQRRRLRMAVELDCDRRVLRGSGELRRYATLLVDMGRRGALARLRAVGLTHPLPLLERRIRTMTRSTGPTRAATAALAVAACVFANGALRLDAPPVVPAAQASGWLPGGPPAREVVSPPPPPVQSVPAVVEGQAAPPSVEPPVVPVQEQVVGRITGRVTDAVSGAPLQYVQVYIREESLGTITRATGAFEIAGVPAGTYELRAERLGLALGSVEVVVPDGGTAEAIFQLRAQAIGLDEIISDSVSAPTPPPVRAAPPPTRSPNVPPGTPVFTPFTVRPSVTNASEVRNALRRGYPTELRDAGIGGTVFVNVFVDETGLPRNKMINRSSGSSRLDEVALAVVGEVRFSPGLNRDQAVAVWVTFPLTFRP